VDGAGTPGPAERSGDPVLIQPRCHLSSSQPLRRQLAGEELACGLPCERANERSERFIATISRRTRPPTSRPPSCLNGRRARPEGEHCSRVCVPPSFSSLSRIRRAPRRVRELVPGSESPRYSRLLQRRATGSPERAAVAQNSVSKADRRTGGAIDPVAKERHDYSFRSRPVAIAKSIRARYCAW
jgi:hypothetical protein